MDTLIIGGVKYNIDSVDPVNSDILNHTIEFLTQVKNTLPLVETEQDYYEMNNLIDEIEDLVDNIG